MNWNKDRNRHSLDDIEDLAYPPTGGRGKIILLGVLLPIGIASLPQAHGRTRKRSSLAEETPT